MSALNGYITQTKTDLLQLGTAVYTGTTVTTDATGISGTIQYVQDGAGTATALGLSTAGVTVNGVFKIGTSTITLGGALTTVGAYGITFTATGTTSLTLPTSGTVLTSSSKLSDLAATTSLELKGVISDETGSGALVFATSPTLVTPVLGTPSSGNLSSCTAYPLAQLTGAGTGVLTFLATPSSANLISAITDETGTGALVFANTPTLVTPILGTPTSGTLTNCTGLPVAGISGSAMNAGTPWTPGFTGFSSNPTYSVCTYQKIGRRVFINMVTSGAGTSNATGFTITGLPFAAAYTIFSFCQASDNSTLTFATFSVTGTTITLYKGTSNTAATWTASGSKSAEIHFSYESTT